MSTPDTPTGAARTAEQGHCSHLRVSYRTREASPGHVVAAWWECDSGCGTRFVSLSHLAGQAGPEVRGLVDALMSPTAEGTIEMRTALLASHAALEERVKELEEDLANATGGFDAAMGLADAEQERAKAAEQRVRDLEGAIDCACNALTDSIMASGNDARTNLHWVNKLRGYLRGTGEGNRG
jgi:hypothetical protein